MSEPQMRQNCLPDLYDLHFHLDFAADARSHALAARAAGLGVLAVSCEPEGYRSVAPLAAPWLVPALGLHPWWVADGSVGGQELDDFERLAPNAPAFGELGLDFDDRHTPASSHGTQIEIFERACMAAYSSSRKSGHRKPLSLHAFRAAGTVLDVLERTGCLESCSCVFHWFSGSQPELKRAREAGCWFSVNERCARSRRWKEYAKLIPPDCLLLETDLPPSPKGAFSLDEQLASLEQCASTLETLLGHDVREQLADNSRKLLARSFPASSSRVLI